METKDIYSILKIIFTAIKGKKIIWRLDGSANLKIQGVDVSVRDLDIDTTNEGIDIFRNVFKKYIVKNIYNEKIKRQFLICNINEFEIEINFYNDRKFDMFDKIKIVNWQDLDIPILPLKYAKKFYKLINRKEKVDLIEKYLKK